MRRRNEVVLVPEPETVEVSEDGAKYEVAFLAPSSFEVDPVDKRVVCVAAALYKASVDSLLEELAALRDVTSSVFDMSTESLSVAVLALAVPFTVDPMDDGTPAVKVLADSSMSESVSVLVATVVVSVSASSLVDVLVVSSPFSMTIVVTGDPPSMKVVVLVVVLPALSPVEVVRDLVSFKEVSLDVLFRTVVVVKVVVTCPDDEGFDRGKEVEVDVSSRDGLGIPVPETPVSSSESELSESLFEAARACKPRNESMGNATRGRVRR